MHIFYTYCILFCTVIKSWSKQYNLQCNVWKQFQFQYANFSFIKQAIWQMFCCICLKITFSFNKNVWNQNYRIIYLSKCMHPLVLSNFWHANMPVNSLRPRQNGRHFADDIFKCIFLNENVWIPIKISLKFVSKGPINNIPSLIQIMAWRRPGDKPLSEPMMVSLLTHICVTRPQWVNLWVLPLCSGALYIQNHKLYIQIYNLNTTFGSQISTPGILSTLWIFCLSVWSSSM